MLAENGLDRTVEVIKFLLHIDPRSYDVVNRANDYILKLADQSAQVYGFDEPLRFLNAGTAEEKPGTWWFGDVAPEVSGLALTMYFGGAHRLQDTRNQDDGRIL
jgi:hypothetical protein